MHGEGQLPQTHRMYLETHEAEGFGVSIMSCWEVAKLVEYARLTLPCPIAEWLDQVLSYPGMRLLDLTPHIVVESTQMPGTFHHDPADQLIVARARIYTCAPMTVDPKLVAYPHVQTLP